MMEVRGKTEKRIKTVRLNGLFNKQKHYTIYTVSVWVVTTL